MTATVRVRLAKSDRGAHNGRQEFLSVKNSINTHSTKYITTTATVRVRLTKSDRGAHNGRQEFLSVKNSVNNSGRVAQRHMTIMHKYTQQLLTDG